jgi:hypothetical protein
LASVADGFGGFIMPSWKRLRRAVSSPGDNQSSVVEVSTVPAPPQ